MGMWFAPIWLRQVSPLVHKTTLTTAFNMKQQTDLYLDYVIFRQHNTVSFVWQSYAYLPTEHCISLSIYVTGK